MKQNEEHEDMIKQEEDFLSQYLENVQKKCLRWILFSLASPSCLQQYEPGRDGIFLHFCPRNPFQGQDVAGAYPSSPGQSDLSLLWFPKLRLYQGRSHRFDWVLLFSCLFFLGLVILMNVMNSFEDKWCQMWRSFPPHSSWKLRPTC